jgi:adenylate cyclase
MMDLRGFTARSEREAPGRIVSMLNAWCEEATAAIHAHGGTVDKFMGDGILALFGAPAPLAEPCSAAFAAARDMLERMQRFGKKGAAAGGTPIEVDIGLACGEATVGHIGAATRYAYTAIGDCVNVAARLEALAQDVDYPLLLSQAVVARLAAGERERLVSLGIQTLKGHSPIEVFGWR